MKRVFAVLLCLIAPIGIAHAVSLRGDPADRQSSEPLRQADIAAALDGRSRFDAAVSEGYSKLPDRCTDRGATTQVDPCEDTLRCRWLAARYDVLAAWSSNDGATRAEVGERLHRLADAMRAGMSCEGGARARTRHADDTVAAEIDDAHVQLALLVASRVSIEGMLGRADEAAVAALLEEARRTGIAGVDRDRLRARRAAIGLARTRALWLAEQPAIAELRRVLPAIWEPVGGIPEGCGRELLDPERLNDQWRGFLVREEIPRALSCLESTLVPALQRAGRRPADPSVLTKARALADLARRDSGGRRFGTDPVSFEGVRAIAKGLTPAAPPASGTTAVASKSAKPSAKPKGRSTEAPSRPTRAASPAVAEKPAASARTSTSSVATETADPPPDEARLLALARRVAAVAGGDDRIVARAREARRGSERTRELEALVVTLHRHVCAPIESLDPGDLGAVRRALGVDRNGADESACRAVQGERGLETMLAAAPDLLRLRWAAELRAAARETALDRADRAIERLDSVPDTYRGATWALLQAWASRKAGDPVGASRAMAMLDPDAYEHLRGSDDEAVARLAAHASTLHSGSMLEP